MAYNNKKHKEQHIRWNSEILTENVFNSEYDKSSARYHFVIIDTKWIGLTFDCFLNEIRKDNSEFNMSELVFIRLNKGMFHRPWNKLKYLFVSYDLPVSLQLPQSYKIDIPIIRDRRLYERRNSYGIEDYVRELYG